MEEPIDIAIEAAKRASEYLIAHFGTSKNVWRKESHHSIVSRQDKESEDLIISTIKKKFPYHSIISEESDTEAVLSDYVWVIDPLDGSSYYARGLSSFSVSLALLYRWEIILGVISCPANKELFHALKGRGAYLNGNNIQTSKIEHFHDSIFSFGHKILRLDNFRSQTRILLLSVRSIRGGGSCAQELCNVACGRTEALIKLDQSIWDYAAGKLIVEEAGGTFSDFYGNIPTFSSLRERDFCFLASNSLLHEKVLKIFSEDKNIDQLGYMEVEDD